MQPYRTYLHEKAKEVLETIPRPFGTFEKTKYVLRKHLSGQVLYRFTTTVHNTFESIEILKEKAQEGMFNCPYTIYKIKEDKKERLFSNVNFNRP